MDFTIPLLARSERTPLLVDAKAFEIHGDGLCRHLRPTDVHLTVSLFGPSDCADIPRPYVCLLRVGYIPETGLLF